MTVSIMMILLVTGAINYLEFLDKQRLYQSGTSVEALLKDARTKAQIGFLGDEEVGFCAQLAAIEFFSGLNANNKISFTTQLRCLDNSVIPLQTQIIQENGTLLDKSFQINFLPMRGANLTINSSRVASGSATLSRDDATVIFNFDQGGAIDVKYQ